MLAHRVLIQAPQPRLHPGTRHRGSPPLTGLAPNQQALIRTWETEPIACSATGCSTQERGVTHQLLGSSIRLTRLSLGKLWSAAAAGSCLLDCFTSPLLDLGPPACGTQLTGHDVSAAIPRCVHKCQLRTTTPTCWNTDLGMAKAPKPCLSRPVRLSHTPAQPATLPTSVALEWGRDEYNVPGTAWLPAQSSGGGLWLRAEVVGVVGGGGGEDGPSMRESQPAPNQLSSDQQAFQAHYQAGRTR